MQRRSTWVANRQNSRWMQRMTGSALALTVALLLAWLPLARAYAQDDPAPVPTDVTTGTLQPSAETLVDELGDFIPGQLIVGVTQVSDDTVLRSAMAGLSAEFIDVVDSCLDTPTGLNGITIQRWRVTPGNEAAVLEILRQQPQVAFAEQDGVVHAAQDMPSAAPTIPAATDTAGSAETAYAINDPLYPDQQWGPQRINLSRALQLVAASGIAPATIRVAVIDSGVDFTHPDLAGRLLPGKNYFVTTTLPTDDYGHGTHVAGIIAAVTNNALGVAGTAQNVLIDPRKVLNSAGGGSISDLHTAICESARDGARVINMSLEISPLVMSPGSSNYELVKAAVDYAANKGALLVAAGGNSAPPRGDGTVWYPARFSNVLAVAALTVNNTKAGYGPEGVELGLAAPGGDSTNPILSTWPSAATVRSKCANFGRYLIQSGSAWYCAEYGTSMAAPYVAGAAALTWSLRPSMTAAALTSLLKNSARSVGLPATVQGAGLVDPVAAARFLLLTDAVVTPPVIGAAVAVGTPPFTTTATIANPSSTPLTVNGSVVGTGGWYSVTNIAGTTFAATISYGRPAFLSVVISPTNLVTGVVTSSIVVTATRAGGTPLEKNIAIFAAVGNYAQRLFLSYVAKATPTTRTAEQAPLTWEPPISPTTTYTLTANSSVEITLPFAFPLPGPVAASGPSYTRAVLYANGFVHFPGSEQSAVPSPAQNQCLPIFGLPKQAVFGWWADLDPSIPGGAVSTFAPDTDRFVIQFDNVASSAGVTPPYRVSFQMVLSRNGDVILNYRDAPPLSAVGLQKAAPLVTVGVQARGGLYHNQVACINSQTALGELPRSGQSIWITNGAIY